MPRPIEFTRPEFGRGYPLARRANEYYLLVRLFHKGHRYWKQVVLDEAFVNWRTQESIGGKAYPGLVMPLELGREFHEREYLEHGQPQSANLLAQRADDGSLEFYAHIAFEFNPEPIETAAFLGIDRGAAKIGAATVVDAQGRTVAEAIDLEGKGIRKKRLFKLRGLKADIVIREYASRVVAEAVKQRTQIVLEKSTPGLWLGFSLRASSAGCTRHPPIRPSAPGCRPD